MKGLVLYTMDAISDKVLYDKDRRIGFVPPDFTSPEELYEHLVRTIRSYHPSSDLSLVEKAYKIAFAAHKDQLRKSGEP